MYLAVKDAFILSALHYIFKRTDRLAATHLGDVTASLPLIINISYGYTGVRKTVPTRSKSQCHR